MLRRLPKREEPLEAKEISLEAAACQPAKPQSTARTRSSPPVCSKHRQVGCSECFLDTTPAHHCQALIAVCQDCGLHHPVVADACLLHDKTHKMSVADGTVGATPVRVLRDTGCSTVVVRRSLVPDEKLTGQEKRCVLIDGTIPRTPDAKIDSETPCFTGTVLAVCMDDPICDLVVGNNQGVMDPLHKPGKGFFYRRGQRTSRKDRPRRNRNNKRQPDLNRRKPSPGSELVTLQPKLKLLPRTVKDPVNAVVHTERNASIFGTGKPRGSSLVISDCQIGFHTPTWA